MGCTTDGASTMVKFGLISPMLHQLCYNQAIHLAIIDFLYSNSHSEKIDFHESEVESDIFSDTDANKNKEDNNEDNN